MDLSTNWNTKEQATLLFESSKNALNLQPNLKIYEKNTTHSTEIYTNVDVEIEKNITQSLLQKKSTDDKSKNISIIGEESIAHTLAHTDITTLLKKPTYVIDPIDGTQNFINKLPNWAISIGLIENMEFTEGAIALPVLGELFVSETNKVFNFKTKSQLSEVSELQLSLYKKPPLSSTKHLTFSKAQLSFQLNHIHKYQMNRSCVYAVAKVITSSYFAYIGKANIWDYAGCIGLFRALGLPVYYYIHHNKTIHTLPWHISEKHWKNFIYTRYPLIFATSYELACSILPLQTPH